MGSESDIRNLSNSLEFKLGQSDSSVYFQYRNDGTSEVRKEASTENIRFLAQYSKHVEALARPKLTLKVPSISELHRNPKAQYYTMAYIPSEPLGMFLQRAKVDDLKKVTDAITGFLTALYSESREDNDSSISKALIERVKTLGGHHAVSSLDLPFLSLLPFVEKVLGSNDVRTGWNHGDFSMENLLCTSRAGEIYAIDFLDSPAETPLLDWGRLWLDARYGWWATGIAPTAAWILNANRLARSIESAARGIGISNTTLDCFAAVAILRIVPYTKNPMRMAFLKNAARQITREHAL